MIQWIDIEQTIKCRIEIFKDVIKGGECVKT